MIWTLLAKTIIKTEMFRPINFDSKMLDNDFLVVYFDSNKFSSFKKYRILNILH